jgi:hypothetical protein
MLLIFSTAVLPLWVSAYDMDELSTSSLDNLFAVEKKLQVSFMDDYYILGGIDEKLKERVSQYTPSPELQKKYDEWLALMADIPYVLVFFISYSMYMDLTNEEVTPEDREEMNELMEKVRDQIKTGKELLVLLENSE